MEKKEQELRKLELEKNVFLRLETKFVVDVDKKEQSA